MLCALSLHGSFPLLKAAPMQVRMSELITSKDERERLYAEIKMLKQLKHKNIMTFYDSWMDPKSYHINFITELFTSGTLRQCAPRLISAAHGVCLRLCAYVP